MTSTFFLPILTRSLPRTLTQAHSLTHTCSLAQSLLFTQLIGPNSYTRPLPHLLARSLPYTRSTPTQSLPFHANSLTHPYLLIQQTTHFPPTRSSTHPSTIPLTLPRRDSITDLRNPTRCQIRHHCNFRATGDTTSPTVELVRAPPVEDITSATLEPLKAPPVQL